MSKVFSGFDVVNFWKESEYARQEYTDAPPTAEIVAAVEDALGYTGSYGWRDVRPAASSHRP